MSPLSSPRLSSVDQRTELRGDSKHFAWIANDDDGAHVLFFNGTTFTLVKRCRHELDYDMEDGQTVTAGIRRNCLWLHTRSPSRHNGGNVVARETWREIVYLMGKPR